MKKYLNLFVHSVIFVISLQIYQVQANLLISPTKVIFKDRQRSEQIILINNGNETQTYRVKWEEMKSLPTGNYKALTKKEINEFPIASTMIRFSPKQVTIKPGGRQVIKLAVRRPKNLETGEYRSHMVIKALPTKGKKSSSNGLSMNLKLLLSYSLPIVVRKGGGEEPKINIDNVKLSYKVQQADSYVEKQKTDAYLEIGLNRSGLYSSNGNLVAYWKAGNKEEKIITRVHDLTIYPEVEQAKINLTWPNAAITNGLLRIEYQGRGEFRGNILAEKTIDVMPSMFKKRS